MKRMQASVFVLLALGWLAVAMRSAGANSFPSANNNSLPQITLNGLCSFFDDKCALFKARSEDGSGRLESYFLAEGQHADGLQLLTIDMKAGKIRINNHGVIQSISLCRANLATLAANPAAGSSSSTGISNAGMNSVVTALSATAAGVAGNQLAAQSIGAGSLGRGDNGTPAAPEKDAGSQNSASPPDSGAQAADVADVSPKKPESYSLKAAREFERLRIQTAAAVYDGTDEPIPLTPLTPIGTPLALIGPERAWFPED